MIANSDGTFWLDEGEAFPFICPRCDTPQNYNKEVIMVLCVMCNYLGTIDEFTAGIEPVQQ